MTYLHCYEESVHKRHKWDKFTLFLTKQITSDKESVSHITVISLYVDLFQPMSVGEIALFDKTCTAY